ncbi:MAG TPA: DHA2 family efflux MFS transporter permease subunit, partial [Phenylobacterium sp.]|nr:DHA2 family efflux MFS transporter permease subunit [Phenylobacterium sp.]
MTSPQDVANRVPITIAIMLATVMNSLDTTIANVALPHIQGSVSASQDQITWVLTSYIVAAAIMTPMSGWLADRVGRKRLYLISIAGFTIASMLCGVADSLVEIVGFRLLQGLFGAALIPIAQAILLDINPPEKHGQAMAIWGAGAILGPILGPAIGGWLTEQASWRWVFFINLPIGILAFAGVFLFISRDGGARAKPFDFLGYASLVGFIGGLQLMLDRGPGEDWFASPEIWTYLLVTIGSLWVFLVHTLTAAHPFFDRALARDRNFVTASIFGFFIGILLFSTVALLPPMMQGLMGY